MIRFTPFAALRPAQGKAKDVAALPYDVMNSEEARAMTRENPDSFLRIDRAEINLPEGTDPHDDAVYDTARDLLEQKIRDGVYAQDENPHFYLYRLTWKGHDQTGIVGLLHIEDYENDKIKKHEFTRADKEKDRIRHVETTRAHTGPIFITYRAQEDLRSRLERIAQSDPMEDISFDDGVRHRVWLVEDEADTKAIQEAFANTDAVYIADGHHRTASAVRVGQKCRAANPNHTGDEEYNRFLSVLFADEELRILDYNRVVKDTNGKSEDELLAEIAERFDVEELPGDGDPRPSEPHTFTMFLGDNAWKLTAKPGTFLETDPVNSLDCAVLQNNLLAPVLGIGDPRIDDRIDFVGGIRGPEGVRDRLKKDAAVGFLLYPVAIEQLMRIADTGEVMPPKSTWFEPKLRSGLFIHRF